MIHTRLAGRVTLLALTICLLLTAFAGCSRVEPQAFTAADTASKERAPNSPGRYLAIEHSLQINAEEEKIAAVHAAGHATCQEASEAQCVILRSRLSSGKVASADIRFRAKPAGIRKLIAMLGTQGTLVSQSMSAEDLARPIEDSAKKLAMLKDYQSKLEALRGRASSDIEALIKVNQELAQVVSQIESITGERAYLTQRVETEILNVSITSIQSRSVWLPVSNALSTFASNLSQNNKKI